MRKNARLSCSIFFSGVLELLSLQVFHSPNNVDIFDEFLTKAARRREEKLLPAALYFFSSLAYRQPIFAKHIPESNNCLCRKNE
jgi:hypothetical protein